MVEFIRDVLVVLALLMSLFALAYQTPTETDAVRTAAPPRALVHTGTITVAPSVSAPK